MIDKLQEILSLEERMHIINSDLSSIRTLLQYEKIFYFKKDFFESLRKYSEVIWKEYEELKKKLRVLNSEFKDICDHRYLSQEDEKYYRCLICDKYFSEEDISFNHTLIKCHNACLYSYHIRKALNDGEDVDKELLEEAKDVKNHLRLIRRNYEKK